MTHEELEALPDVTPALGSALVVVDGKMVRIPTAQTEGFVGALFLGPDDGEFCDARDGTSWSVGWADGNRVKRRV